ncbi:metalloproteinase inhibitor 2-like [Crassostrea virginica]
MGILTAAVVLSYYLFSAEGTIGAPLEDEVTLDECGCVQKHPQEHFCTSEVVFKGQLLNVFTLSAAPAIRIRPILIRDPSNDVIRRKRSQIAPPPFPFHPTMTRKTVTYTFSVDEVFKGKILPGMDIKVKAHEDTTGCLSSFIINNTYLVTGNVDANGDVNNDVCDWSGCWENEVSLYQKINLKNGGYSCDVKICHRTAEYQADTGTCRWPRGARGQCYSRHAKCYTSRRFGRATWAVLFSKMNRCLRNLLEVDGQA